MFAFLVFSSIRRVTFSFTDTALVLESNELSAVPAGTQPKYKVVQPKLALMEKYISDLDAVIQKLVRLCLSQIRLPRL